MSAVLEFFQTEKSESKPDVREAAKPAPFREFVMLEAPEAPEASDKTAEKSKRFREYEREYQRLKARGLKAQKRAEESEDTWLDATDRAREMTGTYSWDEFQEKFPVPAWWFRWYPRDGVDPKAGEFLVDERGKITYVPFDTENGRMAEWQGNPDPSRQLGKAKDDGRPFPPDDEWIGSDDWVLLDDEELADRAERRQDDEEREQERQQIDAEWERRMNTGQSYFPSYDTETGAAEGLPLAGKLPPAQPKPMPKPADDEISEDELDALIDAMKTGKKNKYIVPAGDEPDEELDPRASASPAVLPSPPDIEWEKEFEDDPELAAMLRDMTSKIPPSKK